MVLLSLIPLPRPPATVPFMPPVGPPVMILFSFKFTHPSPLHSGLRVTVGTDDGKEGRAGGGGEGLSEQGRSGRENSVEIGLLRPRRSPLREQDEPRGRDDDRGRRWIRRHRRRSRRGSSIGAGFG